MSVDRIERVNELIRRELGEAMFRLITDTRFDRSSVTITQVSTARNLRTAHVLVSVRGDEQHQQQMLGIIRRFRSELQQAVNRDLSIKYTPVLHFELDPSLQKGDHVLDLLCQLEHGIGSEPGTDAADDYDNDGPVPFEHDDDL
jgi:ribosome-binding factor A